MINQSSLSLKFFQKELCLFENETYKKICIKVLLYSESLAESAINAKNNNVADLFLEFSGINSISVGASSPLSTENYSLDSLLSA